jgi:hypothetical protein
MGGDVLSKDGQPEMYATYLMGYMPVKLAHNLFDMTVKRQANKSSLR